MALGASVFKLGMLLVLVSVINAGCCNKELQNLSGFSAIKVLGLFFVFFSLVTRSNWALDRWVPLD